VSNQIQPFDFNSIQVRVLTDEHGNPWFLGADVCAILGTATNHIREYLDADEITNIRTTDIAQNGGKAPVFVSESGLYSLVLRSRKPEAREFKRWVTHEVLPSIRQTGSYSTDSFEVALATALLTPKAVAGILTELDKTQIENRQLAARNAELEPKAKALDDFTNVTGTMSVAEAANQLTNAGAGNIGRDQLFQFMRSLGWVYRRDNAWAAMQDHINAGHLVMKEHRVHGEHRNGVPFAYAPTVRVTRAGLALLHRRWCERQFKA
jgi:anti-repressor protein